MDQHQNTKLSQDLNGMLFLQVYANKSRNKMQKTYEYTTLKKHLFHKNGRIVCFYNIYSLIYLYMTVPIC